MGMIYTIPKAPRMDFCGSLLITVIFPRSLQNTISFQMSKCYIEECSEFLVKDPYINFYGSAELLVLCSRAPPSGAQGTTWCLGIESSKASFIGEVSCVISSGLD